MHCAPLFVLLLSRLVRNVNTRFQPTRAPTAFHRFVSLALRLCLFVLVPPILSTVGALLSLYSPRLRPLLSGFPVWLLLRRVLPRICGGEVFPKSRLAELDSHVLLRVIYFYYRATRAALRFLIMEPLRVITATYH